MLELQDIIIRMLLSSNSKLLRSRPYIIKNTMQRQQSIISRRANGFVLIVLEIVDRIVRFG